MGLARLAPYLVTVLVILVISAGAVTVSGQGQFFQDTLSPHYYNRITDVNPRTFRSNDTLWIYSGICKVLKTTMLTGIKPDPYLTAAGDSKTPFLKVQGTIQYDFTYRSLVDTPFAQTDFAQHSVQAIFNFMLRDKYPVRMTVLSRRSNSPYFDDITDVNVQFNQGMFLNQLKNDLQKKLPVAISRNSFTEIEKLYQQKKWQAQALQDWISHPARVQEIIESREFAARRRIINGTGINIPSVPELPDQRFIKKRVFAIAEQRIKKIKDSLAAQADSLMAEKKNKKDSLENSDVLTTFQQKKEELNKALKEIKDYESKLGAMKKSFQDSIGRLKQGLAQITTPAQLKNFIRQHKLNAEDLPKGWQKLSVINNIGIGRTWVDYSELTVKNISLTGINAELNPSKFYVAFAAGKVNYRFRDFIIKNNDQPKQALYLLRAGMGQKESNNLIFTWYEGKRNMLNSFGNTTVTIKPERVMGMSVQSRLGLDVNNYIILEFAKSSFHNTGTVNQGSDQLIKKVWNFKDRSNEAFSLKFYNYWPQSNTKLTGYYRKMGEHFQSFNLQPVNVNQDAYQFKVQQSFWKKRLTMDAGVRKNDFNSPYINPGLSSKTVFKSIQATLRIPKYPFVSVGYYPSSQLTILNNNVIVENQYNTFSALVSHSYRFKKVSMSTNAIFLRFYNSGADTGFIYYNASSWTVNQFIFLKGFQLQTSLILTEQQRLKVVTIEQSGNYQAREWLTINGGLKYNRLNNIQTLWGATAGLGLAIRKMGTIQVNYDKSYLPGAARNLLPVDMGRVTWYRSF